MKKNLRKKPTIITRFKDFLIDLAIRLFLGQKEALKRQLQEELLDLIQKLKETIRKMENQLEESQRDEIAQAMIDEYNDFSDMPMLTYVDRDKQF